MRPARPDIGAALSLAALRAPALAEARELGRSLARRALGAPLSRLGLWRRGHVERDGRLSVPPRHVVIDTGDVCNLRCPFCPTGRGLMHGHARMLPLADFERLLARVAPFAEHVALYNWGEPLLNPDLLQMVARLSERSIHSSVDSNLSVADLGPADAEAIVRSGLGALTASIDGASQQSYARYRVRGDFARTQRNLRALVAAKRRLGSRTPRLVWKFLVNGHNEHELDRARALAREIGVPIHFALMDIWAGEEGRGFESRYHRRAAAAARLGASLRRARPPLARRYPLPLASLELHDGLTPFCRQPFSTLYVAPSGDVMPCCNVWGAEFSLGNLLEQSADVIWNGPAMRASRRFLLAYGPAQSGCSVCETLPCPLERKELDARS